MLLILEKQVEPAERYAPDNFVRLSDRTFGETTLAKTLTEISTAARSFVSHKASSAKKSGAYILEFTTANKANGRLYQYEVRYQNQKQPATYTTPVQESGSGYGLYIFIIVALVGGGMAWFLYQAKQKKLGFESGKQTEQDALLREATAKENRLQQELNRPASVAEKPSPARDLKKTIVAGGGTAPILMVSAGAFLQNFTLDQTQMTIGRGPGNDIVIPEATVSGKHALITNENGSFYLSDMGSTNGTLVNNSRIQTKYLLKSGDVIRMGAAQLKFQV